MSTGTSPPAEAMEAGPSPPPPRARAALRTGAADAARPVTAVALSFVACGLLLLVAGINPLRAFGLLLQGGFLNPGSLANTLVRTCPLLLMALGVALAFRAGVLNIGAEGQFSVGAVCAAVLALWITGLPTAIVVIIAMVGGALAGAALAGIAALLRVYRGVNEVVTTLLLNYVGVFLPAVLVGGPLKDPGGGGYPQSPAISNIALPPLVPGTNVHLGLGLALLAAAALAVVMAYSRFGFEVRAVGSNLGAARRAGVDTQRVVVVAFLVSGALGGLAGAIEIAGVHQRLYENVSFGYGYLAIIVALLGGLRAVAVVVAAVFFAGLLVGGSTMQQLAGVPVEIVSLIQALSVMFLMAHLRRRRRKRSGSGRGWLFGVDPRALPRVSGAEGNTA